MRPIIVLGAGLSGLSCAVQLHRADKKILVLEKQSHVGGRVASRHQEGFVLDEGFQVLLASYPELSNVVSLDSLGLRAFYSGALIFNGKQLELLANPFKHPRHLFSNLKISFLTLTDIFLVIRLLFVCNKNREDSYASPLTTEQFLKNWGFSTKFIENFWRPFLSGVFLDQDLSLPADFFLFLVRCFSRGQVTIPSKGMQDLPQKISEQLPKSSLRLNTRVTQFTENRVTLESGEEIEAEKVVCAFDQKRHNKDGGRNKFRSVTTLYYTAEKLTEVTWGRWLVLIPRNLGMTISHLTLLNQVAPSYSNSGKSLLSVSIIGGLGGVNPEQIKDEINQIAGFDLQLKEIYRAEVPEALPMPDRGSPGFQVENGVIYCGDQWSSPSINGALRSGRLAAEYLLSLK